MSEFIRGTGNFYVVLQPHAGAGEVLRWLDDGLPFDANVAVITADTAIAFERRTHRTIEGVNSLGPIDVQEGEE